MVESYCYPTLEGTEDGKRNRPVTWVLDLNFKAHFASVLWAIQRLCLGLFVSDATSVGKRFHGNLRDSPDRKNDRGA